MEQRTQTGDFFPFLQLLIEKYDLSTTNDQLSHPLLWCYLSQSVRFQNKLLTSVISEPFLSLYQNFYTFTSPCFTVSSGALPITSPNPAWTRGLHTGMLPLSCPRPLTFFHCYYSNSKPRFIPCHSVQDHYSHP